MLDHLQEWFNSLVFRPDVNASDQLTTSVLFENCVFDQLMEQTSTGLLNEQVQKTAVMAGYLNDNRAELSRMLEEQIIRGRTYIVRRLINMAKLKCALCMLGKFTHDEESFEQAAKCAQFKELNDNMRQVMDALTSKTTYYYLIKQLFREFGSASLAFISNKDEIAWMTLKSTVNTNNQIIIDRFIINEEGYLKCKKAIYECFKQGKTLAPLDAIMSRPLLPHLCMALYQSVTAFHRFNPQIGDTFQSLTTRSYVQPEDARLIQTLLANSFENKFKLTDDNWTFVNLTMLLLNVKYAIFYSNCRLLEPLKALITQPASMFDKFLPTMPQDNLYDVRTALTNISENIKFYSMFFLFYLIVLLSNTNPSNLFINKT